MLLDGSSAVLLCITPERVLRWAGKARANASRSGGGAATADAEGNIGIWGAVNGECQAGAKRAVSHLRLLHQTGPESALVEVRIETGRVRR
eukprot:SAG31_NODE_1192_length_9459_cov_15.271581_8_plen_91_part_00